MPKISNYISTFRSINKRWGGTITSGMVETGYMKTDVSALFSPLIQDQLVDAIIYERVNKTVLEISDAAKFAINILKRNLFERTADVGYLATHAEIIDFLKTVRDGGDQDPMARRRAYVEQRLADYQYEYTVYNEIIILDVQGNVRADFDAGNPIARSEDPLLVKTQAVDLHDPRDADKYIETFRPTNLRPGRGSVLIYSQKIEDSVDRNLYERANDVWWWVLTPLFRSLMAKSHTVGLTDDDRKALRTCNTLTICIRPTCGWPFWIPGALWSPPPIHRKSCRNALSKQAGRRIYSAPP